MQAPAFGWNKCRTYSRTPIAWTWSGVLLPIFFLSKNTPDTVSCNPVPQAGRWLHTPVHVHLLKYFRLLVESAVDMCRPFLYTVLVVSVFSQPQLTTKNEIGNPFGKVYLFFFVGAILQQPPCFCWYCAIFISHPPAAENRFSYSYYNRALL